VEPQPIATPALHLGHLFAKAPLGVIGTLIAGLLLGAFWGMGAVFAQGIGLSPTWIAVFMSAAILGGALLQVPIGRMSDSHDRRRVVLIVSIAGAGAAAAAFAVTQWLPIALVACIFLYGGFTFPIYGLSVAHMNDHLSAGEVLDATSGLLLTYGIGATFGPATAGALMTALGPRVLLLYFFILLVVLAVASHHFMRARPPVPEEEKGEFVPMVRTSQAALEMYPGTETEPEADLQQSRDD
jgi:MFS family permease